MLTRKQNWVRGMALVGAAATLCAAGCARPPKITSQVASIDPPPPADLRVGKTPIGGPSEARTGAGAGGAGAAGYEIGRVSGSPAQPTTPPYPYSLVESRMSPIAGDGSSVADRGYPIPPDQPLLPSNANGVTQQLSTAPGRMPVNVNTHSIDSAPMAR